MAQAADAVWLSVLPDMSGFGKGIIKSAGKETDKAGKTMGQRLGRGINIGVAAIVGGATVAGTALYNIGKTFDEMSDTIMVSSGATGKELDALVESAKNVGRQVPADFNTIGDALATLNTLTGATGDSLEDMTGSVVEASRLLGEDASANAEKFGKVMTQWQIPADQGAEKLDTLFVATQNYGVSLQGIMGHLNSYGPILQNAGFEMEEAIGFFSQLEAGGISVSRVMPALNASFRNWAAEGKNSKEELQNVVEEIKNTEDAQEALALASDVFGAQGAQRLTTAIRNGTLELEDLTGALEDSEGAIGTASEETMSFGEHWELFKNNILVEVEPLARKLFDTISEGMSFVTNTLLPEFMAGWNGEDGPETTFTRLGEAVRGVTDFLRDNKEIIAGVAAALVTAKVAMVAYNAVTKAMTVAKGIATGAMKAFNLVMRANPLGLLITAITAVVGALIWFFTQTETGQKIIETVWGAIKTAIGAVWDWLKGVFDGMKEGIASVGQWFSDRGQDMEDAWNSVKNALGVAWNWIDKNVFEPLKSGLSAVGQWFTDRGNDIKGAWNSVKNTLKAGFDFIKKWTFDKMVEGMRIVWNFFSNRVDDIKGAWNSLKSAFKAVWDWIKDNVIDRFRQGVENIAGWVSDAVGNIDRAWRKIANKFRDPINWVINTVWNDGIARVFNNVADAIGISTRLSRNAEIPRFAEGGRHQGGWALVGEEGPELVNFSNPARIYTAAETAQALAAGQDLTREQARAAAGRTPAEALAPMGGNWLSRAWNAVTSWVRGNLASVAATVLDPITSRIASTMSQWGSTGELFGDVMLNAKDRLITWIRGKDDEAPEVGSDGWVRPSRGPITSRFGPRWGGHHAGIDIAGGGPTYAAAAGEVLRTGWNILAGRTGIGIILQHAKDLFTYYGHNPPGGVVVRPGDQVSAGQRIGAQGATGNVTGVHVHFELHRGGLGRAVNPEQLGVFDGGNGWLHPGMLAYHSPRMSKPDAILSNRQWNDIHRLAARGSDLDGAHITGELEIGGDGIGRIVRGEIKTAVSQSRRDEKAY